MRFDDLSEKDYAFYVFSKCCLLVVKLTCRLFAVIHVGIDEVEI